MAANDGFTVPIPPRKGHKGGQIVCSQPEPQVYVLTFSSPPDNRLTPEFCKAVITALDVIEFGYPPGVVVTTSGISKFYSNGLDLSIAMADQSFWENSLYPMYKRFLTYSMPTVALINGHAFAGGSMLAMHHDYRVFTGSGKGFFCVNELDFGAHLPPPLSSIFRVKTSPLVYRTLVLEAKRFDAKAALESGIVDAVGDMDAVLKLVKDRKLVAKGTQGSYGLLKTEMYKECIALLDVKGASSTGPPDLWPNETERKEAGKKWIEQWKASQSQKSKL